jgi:hypothetical protein
MAALMVRGTDNSIIDAIEILRKILQGINDII